MYSQHVECGKAFVQVMFIFSSIKQGLIQVVMAFIKHILSIINKRRFSRYLILRRLALLMDYIQLVKRGEKRVFQTIRYRDQHASHRIGCEYYSEQTSKTRKYLEVRNDWDNYSGFFAYFLMAMQQIRFAISQGLIPFANFDEPYNYYLDSTREEELWEKYFEPIGGVSKNEILKKADEITFLSPEHQRRLGDIYDAPPHSWSTETKDWWDHRHVIYGELIKKYVKVRPEISREVDRFYKEKMASKRVLGVHVRGTDRLVGEKFKKYFDKSQGFSEGKRPQDYFPYVDKYLECYPDCNIFIATDQKQFIKEFRDKYASRVIFTSASRSDSSEAVFVADRRSDKIGEEVLIDCLLLSRCDFLLSGLSAVSEAALYFNPALPNLNLTYPHSLDRIDFSKCAAPTI